MADRNLLALVPRALLRVAYANIGVACICILAFVFVKILIWACCSRPSKRSSFVWPPVRPTGEKSLVKSVPKIKFRSYAEVTLAVLALKKGETPSFMACSHATVNFAPKSLRPPSRHTPNRENAIDDCMTILNALIAPVSLSLACDLESGLSNLFPWSQCFYQWLGAQDLVQLSLPAPFDNSFESCLPSTLSRSLTHLCLIGQSHENLALDTALRRIVDACPSLSCLGYVIRSPKELFAIQGFTISHRLSAFILYFPPDFSLSQGQLDILANIKDCRFVALRVHQHRYRRFTALPPDPTGLISIRGYGGIFNGSYAPPGEDDTWTYGDKIVGMRRARTNVIRSMSLAR